MPELADRAATERRIARNTSRLLRNQQDTLLSALGDPPSISNVSPEMFGQLEAAGIASFRSQLEAVYLQSAQQLMDSQPIGVNWGLVNENAAAWAEQNAGQLVRGVNSTTRNALQKKIAAGIRDGQTKDEIAKSLNSLFSPVRSELIASTETTRAAVQGELEIARQLGNEGVRLVAVWSTSFDERVCPICSPLDGRQQGDGWTEPPPAHPRCRCWINHEGITV